MSTENTTTTTIMNRESVVPTLLELVRNDSFIDVKSRYALAYAIGSMGSEVAPLLLNALRDECENVRLCAGTALRVIAKQSNTRLPALKEALSHDDENVRMGAALAMLSSPRLMSVAG